MINLRAFEKVVILDPHSPVVTTEIDNVVVYPLGLVANQFEVNPWDAVIAPDKGGQARAEEMAESLHQSVVYASKVRDVTTGRLSGFDVNVDAGCHYLVSDDICDGGGTFIGLGEKIREQGATADLYVSHGIFSKGTDALKSIYNNIYTTDSLVGNERNDVIVIPVVKEMENYNA
jgi:ribose-phosphate pyrophosphokinase